MTSTERPDVATGSPEQPEQAAPSMLDLVRLSRRRLFPPGGRELFRHIALLTGLSEGDEVIVAACASGVTLEYFVTEYGAHGSGVEADPELVAAAEARARERELTGSLQFQHAPLDRLPYRDGIFDVALGELGLTAGADPAQAIRELVRVTRPGGSVVLVQLVWKAPVDEERRRLLSDHLGVRPLMLVEWKRLLREAGLERLHTEDWSDEETAFRPQVAKPFPDFAELFSLPEKIGILRRAWRRWGWTGVRTALVREREVHRLLSRERILGLDLVKGTVPREEPIRVGEPETAAADAAAEAATDVAEARPTSEGEDAADETVPPDAPDTRDTEGLPLFSAGDENGGDDDEDPRG